MRKICLAVLLAFILVITATSITRAWQTAVSSNTVTIPPHKAKINGQELSARGRFKISHTVPSGQQMDFYLMTQEQYNRASSGQEPTQMGQDFITKSSGVVGSGYDISPDLNPGVYYFVFRNTGDTPIQLTFSIEAESR